MSFLFILRDLLIQIIRYTNYLFNLKKKILIISQINQYLQVKCTLLNLSCQNTHLSHF